MTHEAKNKLFWVLFGCAILIAVTATFVKSMVREDYFVFQQVSCDPSFESCFVEAAEDLCAESEDPECLQDTEDYVYKMILKKASTIPVCTPSAEQDVSCIEPLSCGPDDSEDDCYYEYCEEDCAEKPSE